MCAFPLSRSSLLVFPGRYLVPSSGALNFCGSCQGTPLKPLALVARGAWVSQDCDHKKDRSWLATIPRALHRQQTETPTPPQSSYGRNLLACPGASAALGPFAVPPAWMYLHIAGCFFHSGLSENIAFSARLSLKLYKVAPVLFSSILFYFVIAPTVTQYFLYSSIARMSNKWEDFTKRWTPGRKL